MTEKNYSTKSFVDKVIARLKNDTGFRAAMMRADNPSTEVRAWHFLMELGNVHLEKDMERQAFALIGAALARERIQNDGSQSLGKALKMCKVDQEKEDESVERRLRRILACDSRQELISVLRQTIRYLQNHDKVSLDYELLLRNILYFDEKVKLEWIAAYYRKSAEKTDENQEDVPTEKEVD